MASRLHRRVLLVTVTSLLWIGGCGSGAGSVADLRSDSHKAYSFEVPADYRTVHERILLRARQRYAFTAMLRHQPGISAELSPEGPSSTITLWDSGGIGIRYRLGAEIRAIDPEHTKVDLYAAGKSDRQEARLWVGWADTPIEE
jgi:hypothetical protein